MENNQELIDSQDIKGERPVFLTVLCILTWVGSGSGFIIALTNIFTVNRISNTFNNADVSFNDLAKEMDNMPKTGEPGEEFGRAFAKDIISSMDTAMEWMPTINLVNIGVCALCILAAFMMWNLKKTGFYIYTFSTIVAITMPLILMGGNLLGAVSAIGSGFFGILFVILYGVNLKHMR